MAPATAPNPSVCAAFIEKLTTPCMRSGLILNSAGLINEV